MNIIIQCAADKYNHGACFLRNSDGRRVLFVADPREYRCMEFLACRPDDTVPGETATWRERVLYLNQREEPGGSMLSCAAELYKHPVYRELTEEFGWENLFILSAGWGLVRGDFRLPYYNITFSNAKNVSKYAKRKRHDQGWKDFCHLDLDDERPLVFFGGKDYAPLLIRLTRGYKGGKFAFCGSEPGKLELIKAGFEVQKVRGFTNWHYECARKWNSRMGLKRLISENAF